jgi:uncharacterized integral membrane protein
MANAGGRLGGSKWASRARMIGLIVLVVLVVVVALKNGQPTTFWFFGWNLQMPKALMLVAAFVLGAVAGAGGYVLRSRRK